MHDRIFEDQDRWSALVEPQSRFDAFATELGLDLERFKRDRAAGEVAAAVEADYQSALLLRVPGTPTFFLNGVEIRNPGSYAEFRNVIQQAIDRAA
jgi:protein-disulfide isomerase